MSSEPIAENRRILVIDDNPDIHIDFRKILACSADDAMREMEADLFDEPSGQAESVAYEIDSAYQGKEGLDLVRQAVQEGRPYAMAFVDLRMPPGWDGVETISRIWQEYSDLEVVICTAYSDYSWSEMLVQLGHPERFLILKKPFDSVEVRQLVCSLTEKWRLGKQARMNMAELAELVKSRTQELQESEARLQAMFDSLLAGIMLFDCDTRLVVDANPAALAMVGSRREEMVGRPCTDFFGPREGESEFKSLPGEASECVLRTSSGDHISVLATIAQVHVHKQRHLLCSFLDLRQVKAAEQERQEMQERLRQGEKLQAIGQLAGGIAHEFNNQLSIINGFAEMLSRKDDIKSCQALLGKVELILQAGRRAGTLTGQLLAYSRKQAVRAEVFSPNNVLCSMRKLFDQTLGEDVELIMELAPDLGNVCMDRGQFSDIVVNLITNARDAMPNGGEITISTENGICNCLVDTGCETAECVRVTVKDTGIGMDESTQKRAFEPFFTTKGVGKGTGLGLAMVHGATEKAGGAIDVDSQLGTGTTISIQLPRASGEKDRETVALVAEAEEATQRDGTILLAEDEESLLSCLRAALTAEGYEVLAAQNGEAALDLARAHSQPIRLLITDVIMPGMNGRQLAEQLQALDPAMKVLFVSGYSKEAISQRHILPADVDVVQKPFVLKELMTKIRDSLAIAPAL